jgi:hypothetical protein
MAIGDVGSWPSEGRRPTPSLVVESDTAALKSVQERGGGGQHHLAAPGGTTVGRYVARGWWMESSWNFLLRGYDLP